MPSSSMTIENSTGPFESLVAFFKFPVRTTSESLSMHGRHCRWRPRPGWWANKGSCRIESYWVGNIFSCEEQKIVTVNHPPPPLTRNRSDSGKFTYYWRSRARNLLLVTRVKMEYAIFFTLYQIVGRKCTHVHKNDRYSGVFLNSLVNEEEFAIVDSDQETSSCNRILRLIGCTDYLLVKDSNIDFLLEKIGTFKKLRASEVYVHVRFVLTRVYLCQKVTCVVGKNRYGVMTWHHVEAHWVFKLTRQTLLSSISREICEWMPRRLLEQL